MNSTSSNATPEAAPQPETPTVEPRPAPQETADTERLVHPGAKLGWADSGGMVEQQASAMEWVRAGGEARAGEGERAAATQERSAAAEQTDSRQAQYSRWTGEPLGEAAGQAQSGGIGQSH
jgi:hypothetical protein